MDPQGPGASSKFELGPSSGCLLPHNILDDELIQFLVHIVRPIRQSVNVVLDERFWSRLDATVTGTVCELMSVASRSKISALIITNFFTHIDNE